MKQETYKITGMSCAACSSAVERVTRKLPGVMRSDVNLTTAKMRIEYDENQVAPEQIIAKIEKAGFGAELFVEDAEKRKKEAQAQAKDLSDSRRRLILAIIFAVPLLYLSMGHMVPFPLPLPKALDMEASPMAFALAQLVLTVPILIFGRTFYIDRDVHANLPFALQQLTRRGTEFVHSRIARAVPGQSEYGFSRGHRYDGGVPLQPCDDRADPAGCASCTSALL